MNEPHRQILLITSLALTTVIVVITAITNADALIDDIQRAVPWTRGSCNIWSGAFLGAMIGSSVASLALAWVAQRAPSTKSPLRTAAVISSLVLVVYWVGLATVGRATCIA